MPRVNGGAKTGHGADTRAASCPAQLVAMARNTIRAAGLTQEVAAGRIGISRPQLASALQGRYGLSIEAASRLLAFLERPPAIRQALLL